MLTSVSYCICVEAVLNLFYWGHTMADRLRKNGDFFKLLLQTHLPQQKALMNSLSGQQVDLLTEVVHNILYIVPLAEKERKVLLRKKFLKEISVMKRSQKYRKKRMQTQKVQLLKVLLSYKDKLLEVSGSL